MLADQRDVLARVALRTGRTLDDDQSLQPVLARFTDRVSRIAGRVDRAAVERILDNAAALIADLEPHYGK